jgi:O-antigen ligase
MREILKAQRAQYEAQVPALGSKDRIYRKIIEYGLIVLLVFSPLPAASVEDWSILIIELGAAMLTAAYLLMSNTPQVNVKLQRSLGFLRWAFIGLFGYLALQIIPWPKSILQLLSPQAYSLQEQFSPRFPQLKFLSLSLAPGQTLREALELLAYVLIGFLVVQTVTHRRQIKQIMTVLVIMGAFEAFYGLFELYRKNPHVFFYKKVYNVGSASGTFVNRNHFSGYLELVIPLAVCLIISRIDMFSLANKNWSEKIAQLTARGFTTNILTLVGLVVMALAVILSNSRSGVFLLLMTFILFFEMTVYHFGKTKYRQVWIKKFLKVTFIIIALAAFYIGVEATVGRFSVDNLLQGGRPQYWGNVLTIVKDFPLFGTGLGTFASVYPVYQTVALEGQLTHAHNDYLEYLSELGLVGFILLLGAIAFIVLDSFSTWSERRNPEIKGLAMGGLIAVVIMLIHSITDFNLHIPANKLLFTVVLSLSYATVYHRKS